MNLECLNDIITSNLAIHIDLTDLNSWDLNTGLTSFSLTKWSDAVSENINLHDFGLTGFDNGRTDKMWEGITLTPEDSLFSMYRVGFNEVENPMSGETSGITVNTQYLPITGITSGTSGNYFELEGGYLQGFFNLEGFNYKVLPTRYNEGITIETLLYLYPDSQGIFYMMGARAEDKYNPYFSGETISGETISDMTTSFDNYLDALEPQQTLKAGFSEPENMYTTTYSEVPALDNIKNNAIAFEITEDKKLGYKYINNDAFVISNTSNPPINLTTGWTIIAMVFTPDEVLDPADLECAEQRTGKLIFYVNGRAIWIIKEFPEFYFKSFANDKEKQEGVPYSISWGGGSFGLSESWHYDYQTYIIYSGQNTDYIDSKFFVEPDPIPTDCYDPPTGDTYLAGFSLSADSTTFTYSDECDPDVELPFTVMRMDYTGGTGTTYFVKFMQPISVLSNRDYVVDLSLYVSGIFSGDYNNKVSVLMYSDDVEVSIVSDMEYVYPLTSAYILEQMGGEGLHPFPDRQEYQWIVDGVMYYGESGFPVTSENANMVGYSRPNQTTTNYAVTGENQWLPIKSTFRTPDNTGQSFVELGLLIETDGELVSGGTIFVKDFVYTAADILVQDERKNNLTIEQNFDYGFIGGIQKLRIYDRAFTSPEVLHNALMEATNDPTKNMVVSKGGRIIYR